MSGILTLSQCAFDHRLCARSSVQNDELGIPVPLRQPSRRSWQAQFPCTGRALSAVDQIRVRRQCQLCHPGQADDLRERLFLNTITFARVETLVFRLRLPVQQGAPSAYTQDHRL